MVEKEEPSTAEWLEVKKKMIPKSTPEELLKDNISNQEATNSEEKQNKPMTIYPKTSIVIQTSKPARRYYTIKNNGKDIQIYYKNGKCFTSEDDSDITKLIDDTYQRKLQDFINEPTKEKLDDMLDDKAGALVNNSKLRDTIFKGYSNISKGRDFEISKSVLNARFKELHHFNTQSKPKSIKAADNEEEKNKKYGKVFKSLTYNDNRIEMRENGIYEVETREMGSETYEQRTYIFGSKLEIKFRVYDKNRNQDVFVFNINDKEYKPAIIREFHEAFKLKIACGNNGWDIMVYILESLSQSLPEEKGYSNLGFDNGWKLPWNLQDSIYLCNNINHWKAYNQLKNKYIKYSNEEKEHIQLVMKNLMNSISIELDKATLLIGWCMAAPFRLYFIDKYHLFPIFAAIGEKITGKTSIFELFTTFFYKIFDRSFSSADLSDAHYGINQSCAVFPNYYDDAYFDRNKSSSLIINRIKASCTGRKFNEKYYRQGEIRENKEEVASFCYSSNHPLPEFSDVAQNSRMIIDDFGDKSIIGDTLEKKEKQRIWDESKTILQNDYYLFILLYEHTKNWTNKTLDKLIEDIKINNKLEIDKIHIYDKRLETSFLIIMLGINLFNDIFNISLPKEKIADLLISGRGIQTSTIYDKFVSYCIEAKSFSSDNKSDYLRHGIEYIPDEKGSNKGYYDFLTENEVDFVKKHQSENIRKWDCLKELYKLLIETIPIEKQAMINFIPSNNIYINGKRTTRSMITIRSELVEEYSDDSNDPNNKPKKASKQGVQLKKKEESGNTSKGDIKSNDDIDTSNDFELDF